MSVTLTRRQPVSSTVASKDQELHANVLVMKFIGQYFNRELIKIQIKGRGKWFEGSAGNQVICHPVTHGISQRNIVTLGAKLHRRNPITAIHIFTRSAEAMDQIREEIDRIVITNGVNPYKGIQYILPASMPSITGDYEEKDEAGTIFHDVYYVECLYYKWV